MEQIEINGLLWDAENLEIDGKKYFTWQEAMDAAKSVGKRLPTKKELEKLKNSYYEFDKERQGAWFADGKLFIPLSGHVDYTSEIILLKNCGCLWSSSPRDDFYSWHLVFTDDTASITSSGSSYGFPVRCVQNIQSDNSTIKENNMEKVCSQWKNASLEPPLDMQIVFIKTKCKSLLAGLGVGYKLPGRKAFEVEDAILSYDSNDVDYWDVFWTEVPK